jgi:CheY-like chemotaxis protein
MFGNTRRPSQICTVLVVEDEPLIRLMVADELRDSGMGVIEAETADEALEHLLAGSPADFIFADIELPGSMNGLQLAKRVRTDFPTLKLLLTSGRLPAHETASIAPFIPKPYDVREVIDCIRAAQDESRPG